MWGLSFHPWRPARRKIPIESESISIGCTDAFTCVLFQEGSPTCIGGISLLVYQPTHLLRYSYLVLYNLVFNLPLVIILALAAAGQTLNRLSHWHMHHKEWVRLVHGGVVAGTGLLIQDTV